MQSPPILPMQLHCSVCAKLSTVPFVHVQCFQNDPHKKKQVSSPESSVADTDLYVLGYLGSESVSQRYGSGSFYHQAKIIEIVRKTLISTVLWPLYDFLSLKTDVNVLKSKNQKNLWTRIRTKLPRIHNTVTLSEREKGEEFLKYGAAGIISPRMWFTRVMILYELKNWTVYI